MAGPPGPAHEGSFYEFEYDITPLLKCGATNLLEVSLPSQSGQGNAGLFARTCPHSCHANPRCVPADQVMSFACSKHTQPAD